MHRWRSLLEGLNLAGQKSWDETQLHCYFPEFNEEIRRHCTKRSSPQTMLSYASRMSMWRELEDELTHHIHRDIWLRRLESYRYYLEQFKTNMMTPAFASIALDEMSPLPIAQIPKWQFADKQGVGLTGKLASEQLTQHLSSLLAQTPYVQLSSQISARASYAHHVIKLNSESVFTDQELKGLAIHEGLIHAGTAMSGEEQSIHRWLSLWSPRITCFQEGLALWSEIQTGTMTQERWLQLCLRHKAAMQAKNGANIREVYQFIHSELDDKEESLRIALRLFRGVPLSGGQVFAKELGYLTGLMWWASQWDRLSMLERQIAFSGKMDVWEFQQLKLAPQGLKLNQHHLYLTCPITANQKAA